MKLVIENQYFAPVSYYSILIKYSNVIFEQCEYYQKRSFRNRCVLAGANGLINLSIPLVNGRDQRSFIRDVKIANQYAWQDQHWKTIVSCYSSSPFFEYYRMDLEFFYSKKFTYLFDWNLELYQWVLGKLKIDIMTSFTDSYQKTYNHPITDMRNIINPSIDLHKEYPEYHQVFMGKNGFIPNLSILDLLCCTGPGAINYLRNTP